MKKEELTLAEEDKGEYAQIGSKQMSKHLLNMMGDNNWITVFYIEVLIVLCVFWILKKVQTLVVSFESTTMTTKVRKLFFCRRTL